MTALRENVVTVCTARLSDWRQPRLNELSNLLNAEEHQRAARFVRPDDRDRFTLAHGGLRSILGGLLNEPPANLEFLINPFGKPQLHPHSSINFNLSHSGDFVLWAFALDGQVGIDVERWRPEIGLNELAQEVFTVEERNRLIGLSREDAERYFFKLWTHKEAYLKARGLGLNLPPKTFGIHFEEMQTRLLPLELEPQEAGRWRFWELEMPNGVSAAVCAERRFEVVEIAGC